MDTSSQTVSISYVNVSECEVVSVVVISVVNNNEVMLQKYFVPHQNLLLTGYVVRNKISVSLATSTLTFMSKFSHVQWLSSVRDNINLLLLMCFCSFLNWRDVIIVFKSRGSICLEVGLAYWTVVKRKVWKKSC